MSKSDIKVVLIGATGLVICQLTDYFFRFDSYTYLNDKIIFGLWGNNLVSIIVSSFIIIYLIYLYYSCHREADLLAKKKGRSNLIYIAEKTSLIIVIAVAFSNILDRILYSGVIDYIKIPFIPRFNLADIFIVGGLIVYAILSKDLLSQE